MNWSQEQLDALDAICYWHGEGNHQLSKVFVLLGYAGTGKTTLAKEVARRIGGNVGFAAYTGKAAHVLQSKGCDDATTIHQLIYRPQSKATEHLESMKAKVEAAWADVELVEGPGEDYNAAVQAATALEREYEEERDRCKMPGFRLNTDSALKDMDLLVVDEVSMVGATIGRDLESFEVPILVLGDKAQLPPVGDGGYFTEREADFMLREVHRQEAGSAVLDMATMVRRGEWLEHGDYGQECRVIRPGELSIAGALAAGQIIVGKNKTRHAVNAKARAHLGHAHSPYPLLGDKLICHRNDHEEGFLNGSIWTATADATFMPDEDMVLLRLISEDGEHTTSCLAHAAPFRGEEIHLWKRLEAQHFEYGYAITCHKAQGSQWPSVVVQDQSGIAGRDRNRWLYTAITRAERRVTIIR